MFCHLQLQCMHFLPYEGLAGFLLVLSIFLFVRHKLFYRRFKVYSPLTLEVNFPESDSSDMHSRLGNINLSMEQMHRDMKGLLITELHVDNRKFRLCGLKELYFSGVDKEKQGLAFRVRPADMIKLGGKRIGIYLKARLAFKDGRTRTVKARWTVLIPNSKEISSASEGRITPAFGQGI